MAEDAIVYQRGVYCGRNGRADERLHLYTATLCLLIGQSNET